MVTRSTLGRRSPWQPASRPRKRTSVQVRARVWGHLHPSSTSRRRYASGPSSASEHGGPGPVGPHERITATLAHIGKNHDDVRWYSSPNPEEGLAMPRIDVRVPVKALLVILLAVASIARALPVELKD